MKKHSLTIGTFAALILATGATWAWKQSGSSSAPPAAPTTFSPALDMVFARPFVLDEGYRHEWRSDRPSVDAGYLLVLQVDPSYVQPRNGLEPVLYVGAQTAERVNYGYPSGSVVAIVPAARDGNGHPLLDLEQTLIWFGTPELPERVDAGRIDAELARARAAGGVPLAQARLTAATNAGGSLVRFANRTALHRYAAERVLEFAEGEEELAQSMLAPLVR